MNHSRLLMASGKLLKADEPFDIHVESNRLGHTFAHVLSLPGCIVRAQTPDQALAYVGEAIHQYLLWLGIHLGTPQPRSAFFQTSLGEHCAGGAASASGSKVALFQPDCLRIDRQELEEYLLRMSYSRIDLLEITAALPDEVLMVRPHKSQRTLREILQHIAGAEQWYLTRLVNVPRFPAQKTHLLRLQVVRETAFKLLAECDLRWSARVVEKDGEAWTLRKVLRRFLEHEREHMLEIERRLHEMDLHAFPAWMPAEAQARELHLSRVFQF